jgi:hypothetical protein
MRILFFLLIILFSFSSCTNAQPISASSLKDEGTGETITTDSIPVYQRLISKATELKAYLKGKSSYDQKIAILIDMRQNSGKNRFFVVDLDSMSILKKGLVAHGSGSETGFDDSLRFSNTPNSYCTSLGKYKIGNAYVGNFGRSYKLHGLDPTNSKAFERFVVLHRYSCVPDEEQLYPICNSLGCPMLSENFFEEVDAVIRKSGKSVLMEIYY